MHVLYGAFAAVRRGLRVTKNGVWGTGYWRFEITLDQFQKWLVFERVEVCLVSRIVMCVCNNIQNQSHRAVKAFEVSDQGRA